MKKFIASMLVVCALVTPVMAQTPELPPVVAPAPVTIGMSYLDEGGGLPIGGMTPAQECAFLLALLAAQTIACDAGAIKACWSAAATATKAYFVCKKAILDNTPTGGPVIQ